MEVLIEHTAKLAKILEKHRDMESGEIREMNTKEKNEAIEILCSALTHIIKSNILDRLHKDIHNQFDKHSTIYSEKDIDEALNFFDTFVAFEEQLFRLKNIPDWVVKETLESTGDIKPLIRKFMLDPSFRQEVLNQKELNTQISKIKETVCKIHEDHVWDREKEQRFILGSVAVGIVNTAADVTLTTMVLFTLISSAASAIVTWRRTRW